MKNNLDEQKVNIRVKIAALWASFMFLYIYVDYFHLYMPDVLADMMAGKVFTFDISQGFLIAALVSVSIPAIMISLSALLPAKFCRISNIVLASVYIPYTLFNLVGEAWPHMFYGAFVEVAVLGLILHSSYRWPAARD